MGRLSITERYEALQVRGAELAATAGPPPSPVHARTMAVLRQMLMMGTRFSSEKVPVPLRAMMRTLEHLEPTLIAELASVPPAAIRQFLSELIAEMQSIVDTPDVEDHAAAGPGIPGAALAPPA